MPRTSIFSPPSFTSGLFSTNDLSTPKGCDCVYGYEDENEWLVAWDNMLEKYALVDNKWLGGIFDMKEKWAMLYGRHMFTADMKSTLRSESMNNALKKYLNVKLDFVCFSEQYSRVLADKRHQELQAEFRMRQTKPVLRVDLEILGHAVEFYTPEIFSMFQDEYLKMMDCKIYRVNKSDTIKEYKVTYRERTQEHLVKYEALTTIVECDCMKFNFIGIICIHALKVLDKKNIMTLSPHYILKRWTKDAKVSSIKDYCGIYIKGNTQESIGKRYSHLSHKFREISTLPAESEMMYEHTKRSFENLLKDLQEMRKKCYSDSMEGRVEVHGEAIHADVLQDKYIQTQQESKHGVGKPQAQPRALKVNPVQFREVVEKVKEIGFNLLMMKFAKAVHVLWSMSKSTWERKVDVYTKWGWSEAEHEISLAFRRHPWCMMVLKTRL
ncbi:hypothetical protein SO802_005627 [Lithocarpus litseifolius]|uniref:Protein FAR1-RELATED SEQUENCE n=1 Tax=Lithocarpus litseifolius TaxID=425828 RepID=A0AAW2DK75_9ROSI